MNDAPTLEVIWPYLTTPEGEAAEVRLAAVEALAELAGRGDRRAIEGIVARLADEDRLFLKNVKRAALLALPKVAEEGYAAAMISVCQCLADKNTYVREAAIDAFLALAGP